MFKTRSLPSNISIETMPEGAIPSYDKDLEVASLMVSGDAEEAFKEIEGSEFDTYLGVLSGFTQAKSVALADLRVQRLMQLPRESVVQRISDVLAREIHPIYMSPWDTALFAYLLALGDERGAVASLFEGKTKNLWWSRRLLEEAQ